MAEEKPEAAPNQNCAYCTHTPNSKLQSAVTFVVSIGFSSCFSLALHHAVFKAGFGWYLLPASGVWIYSIIDWADFFTILPKDKQLSVHDVFLRVLSIAWQLVILLALIRTTTEGWVVAYFASLIYLPPVLALRDHLVLGKDAVTKATEAMYAKAKLSFKRTIGLVSIACGLLLLAGFLPATFRWTEETARGLSYIVVGLCWGIGILLKAKRERWYSTQQASG